MKYFLLITFFFYGCASIGQKNSPPAKYSSDCQVNVQILKSFGDTIRIEYNPSNMAKADKFASDYCLIERKKNSSKNQVNCDGCCTATYICKQKK